MHIAIVHYHLSPGGVTTVIRGESQALTEAGIPHVILCGREAPSDLPARLIADLDYRKNTTTKPATLLSTLLAEATAALGSPPDVWHFHNPTLGKNVLFPEVIRLLAASGEKLLLHLHDLAEDRRPHNHALNAGSPFLYPIAPHIRYAFLNTPDRDAFLSSGLPAASAIILPNPPPPPRSSTLPSGPPLVLYPTRGIRRKNLGEILLLSALAPPGARFAITRAPENPAAKPVHDRWRAFAAKHALPVSFEVTGNTPPSSTFETWLDAATHLITTSVAEGFGMIFPEAAAFGKPLLGRTLPTHPSPGHPSFYDEILIPSSWIDETSLTRHLTAALTETHRLHQQPLDPQLIPRTRALLQRGTHLDFGNLPEPLQENIILRLLADPSATPLINGQPARRWLSETLARTAPFQTSLPSFTEPLLHTLRELHLSPSSPPAYLDPEKILRAFLTPSRFHFLLTSPPKIRAVIFDIYGTLLISKPGAVRPDPAFDPLLSEILRTFGHNPPPAPTSALHAAVLRHHAASGNPHPEIDLRELWQEILSTHEDLTSLVAAIEDAWHPVQPMPGSHPTLRQLSHDGLVLGLLSNAQSNTLPALGNIVPLFRPDLTFLSYEHRIAKPSPLLFGKLASHLATLGIAPHETLYVGNDPHQDILPAAATGFRTALFTGHPDSLRPGNCSPDLVLNSLSDLPALIHNL